MTLLAQSSAVDHGKVPPPLDGDVKLDYVTSEVFTLPSVQISEFAVLALATVNPSRNRD